MSDVPPQGGQPGEGRQPTEEELRAYIGQMRAAPAGQIVAEVVSALLNGAQVKLGRQDARLLLDLAASVTDQSRPHLDGEMTKQVDDALAQLRMAQVEAEREVGERAEDEPNDLGASATPAQGTGHDASGRTAEPGARRPSSAPPQQPGSSAASRLWVPGR